MFPVLIFHDLKYTFGRRLRSTGVSFEDRQDLLGHKTKRMTTHYSTAELLNLWEAANSVCEEQRKPTLTLWRTTVDLGRAKVMQGFHPRCITNNIANQGINIEKEQ